MKTPHEENKMAYKKLALMLLLQLRERGGARNYLNLYRGILELMEKGVITLEEIGSSLDELNQLCLVGAQRVTAEATRRKEREEKAIRW